MDEFYQSGPELHDPFLNDPWLKSYMQWKLPGEIYSPIEKHLRGFAKTVINTLQPLSNEAYHSPPELVGFDPWGRRIDFIRTSSAWKKIESIASQEGLIAEGYERRFGAQSRLYQMALLYLFHPASAFVSCPLAMTDGAARVLEIYGGADLKHSFKHLTSRDPNQFWTSGQWMTERTGGSDVSGTSTVARMENGEYKLYGTKWFTSATTSQMAITLAKIEGEKDLSMFYLETKSPGGDFNQIRVLRLKDKLGTRALPTAELELAGTPARLLGDKGGGVKKISSLLNITRLYNSICSIAALRRALSLAVDYSHRRVAFGRKIGEHSLHQQTILELEALQASGFFLTFFVAELLGKQETNQASDVEKTLLRLLTPVIKLWTAKSAVLGTSECLEMFGGAGYIEDTGLPLLLRDAQVFPLWEGTTNILSLDTLRALVKENALEALSAWSQPIVRQAGERAPELTQAARFLSPSAKVGEFEARRLAFVIFEFSACCCFFQFLEKHPGPVNQTLFKKMLARLKAHLETTLVSPESAQEVAAWSMSLLKS